MKPGFRSDVRATLRLIVAVMAAVVAPARQLQAQLVISGQADVLAKTGNDSRGLNRNFRSDSPYNQIRVRLFAQHWVTEDIGAFTEILFDYVSGPRLNGAYVVANNVAGQEWLSTRIGMAPAIVGNFGLRSTYYNSNPLIGVPLVWQHRTTLDGFGTATAADLIRRREQNIILLPMLYDACWNIQWEVMGEVGKMEYSLGVTPGSLSNPLATADVDGIQVMGRIGIVPTPELRLGLSAANGAYLGGPNRDPATTPTTFVPDPTDYDQTLVGFDANYQHGKVELFSEGYLSRWEAPLIDEPLTMTGAYIEGRYDIAPQLFGALRLDGAHFNEIAVGSAGDADTGWDDDVMRIESSLTYRAARELQLRAGWQQTRFLTGDESPVNLLAVQLRAAF